MNRSDGKRIKNADPMYTVAAHVMDKRYDAMNMITIDVPVEPMQEYMRKKQKENIKLSHMSLILAAYVRTVSQFPMLNRFIMNKRPYARNNISVSMVVLVGGKMDHGTMAKLYFEPTDTVFDVENKITKFIEKTETLLKITVQKSL